MVLSVGVFLINQQKERPMQQIILIVGAGILSLISLLSLITLFRARNILQLLNSGADEDEMAKMPGKILAGVTIESMKMWKTLQEVPPFKGESIFMKAFHNVFWNSMIWIKSDSANKVIEGLNRITNELHKEIDEGIEALSTLIRLCRFLGAGATAMIFFTAIFAGSMTSSALLLMSLNSIILALSTSWYAEYCQRTKDLLPTAKANFNSAWACNIYVACFEAVLGRFDDDTPSTNPTNPADLD